MSRRTIMTVLALGLLSLVIAATSPAQSNTEGKISLESKTVAVGVGVSWGEGTLTYRGKEHKFTIEGLSVADLDVSKVSAQGDVSNLKKVEDFEGTYVAGGTGAAAGGGAGIAGLKNQNGVLIAVNATTQGVRLTLAGGGATIKLKK
jgi:hypothetical protein